MRAKQLAFWLLMFFLVACIVEASLSLFFQFRADNPMAMVRLLRTTRDEMGGDASIATVGIWESDSRFGFAHIANSSGKHETSDFSARYTIGDEKNRHIPTTPNALGRVLFLGGSFTFGHGVNDDENYPYLLSTHLGRWQIVNKAVMGWGTSHAYMALSMEVESAHPPAMVVYAMIPHHIKRNYIRKSWVRTLNRSQPHFEIVDGKPVFQGIVNVTDSVDNLPEVHETEIALTSAFLVEMKKLCETRQIPFIVVLIRGNIPYAINRSLIENDVEVLDLTEIKIEGFKTDRHPNRQDHEELAEAILHSFVPVVLDSLDVNQ